MFLNGLSGPSNIPRPSFLFRYNPSPPFSPPLLLVLDGDKYNPFPSVSIRHTLSPFFKYKPLPMTFCTPVLANPLNAPTPKAGRTVPVNREERFCC